MDIRESTGADREPAPVTDAVKDQVLLSRDLAMMATAVKYDLHDPQERLRSVRELSRLFFVLARALEIDLFVEAGAKNAATSRRARRLLDPARIVAFEANPHTHRAFAAKNAKPALGVEYVNLALSDAPGQLTFRVHLKNGAPNPDGRGSLLARDDGTEGQYEQVTVPATTLDNFFADHDFGSAACWVDVEGAAREVFHGGAGLLARTDVLIVEVEDRRYWQDQWLRPELVGHLYDRGMVPVARDFQTRYQYNIVFVRAARLDQPDVRWAITQFASASPYPDQGMAPAPGAATAVDRLRAGALRAARTIAQGRPGNR